jgi:hypothetical protein
VYHLQSNLQRNPPRTRVMEQVPLARIQGNENARNNVLPGRRNSLEFMFFK